LHNNSFISIVAFVSNGRYHGLNMSLITIPEPTPQEIALARTASSILRAHAPALGLAQGAQGHLRVQVDADGDLIELPPMVTRLLQAILEQMAAGRAISIMPLGAELTTQQAADFLGVSRPFLVKLLESQAIPHRKVGRHRRVRLSDLLSYHKQNQMDRAQALDKLTALGQEMGDYD
jgi:excisionase family DNA binding protein